MKYEHPTIETNKPGIEYTSEEYVSLMKEVDNALLPHHDITYVPLTKEQVLDTAEHIHYVDREKLPDIMATADIILIVGRDNEADPAYKENNPEHNIKLTPSALSNVDTSVELFNLAQKSGNTDVALIGAGRMNNRGIRMMFALPLIAEHIGLNAEDVYHIPEAQFKKLLEENLSPEELKKMIDAPHDPSLDANYRALASLLDTDNMTEDIFDAYQKYPRLPESRLMLERAAAAGVPLENIYEEEGSVDTISNFVNTAHMLGSLNMLQKQREDLNVVVVAGSDHLPRTTWIADHVLPDNIKITCVESDPRLNQEDYDKSCDREHMSFLKGSKWIGGTRDLKELEAIVEAGYFGANYKDTAQIAREVAQQKSMGKAALK